MSILNVEHLSHGFGDRAIFQDVSFRLLKGEHIGLVGANGEGKSTFMNIITGKLMPDEGKVEWAKNVNVGYLDQHTVLEKGMTIREVLKSAFAPLFEMEERMNHICDNMGDADEDQMNAMMEELGTIQDLLMAHDFYVIDSKVEEVGRALGLDEIGMDRDVTELSGGQRTKVLLGKLLLQKPDILLLDEPTNYLDVQHIEWLKRYLQEYENAFILISHDIPFLNSVINLIYHMENQRLDRYVGDYDKFQEVYSVKKAQLEAAYKRQQLPGIEILHHSEYILRLIRAGRLSLEHGAMRFTYHDPCELGRGSGIYDEPRAVIEAVGELLEPASTRENALCCGSSVANTAISDGQQVQIARSVAAQLDATGAEVIVTACPLCKKAIGRGTKSEVRDLAEIVVAAIK